MIQILRCRIGERYDLEFRERLQHLDMRPRAVPRADNRDMQFLLRFGLRQRCRSTRRQYKSPALRRNLTGT